jgi:hypothetical protein
MNVVAHMVRVALLVESNSLSNNRSLLIRKRKDALVLLAYDCVVRHLLRIAPANLFDLGALPDDSLPVSLNSQLLHGERLRHLLDDTI